MGCGSSTAAAADEQASQSQQPQSQSQAQSTAGSKEAPPGSKGGDGSAAAAAADKAEPVASPSKGGGGGGNKVAPSPAPAPAPAPAAAAAEEVPVDELLVLEVKVVSAQGLRKADIVSANDPFVTISLGKQTYRTRTLKNRKNPVWNENVCFSVRPKTEASYDLHFEVHDHDAVSANDFLGGAKIAHVEEIYENLCVPKTYELPLVYKDKNGTEVEKGSLTVVCEAQTDDEVEREFWQLLVAAFDLEQKESLTREQLIVLFASLGVDISDDELDALFQTAFGPDSGDALKGGNLKGDEVPSADELRVTADDLDVHFNVKHQPLQLSFNTCCVCSGQLPGTPTTKLWHLNACLRGVPADSLLTRTYLSQACASKGWFSRLFGGKKDAKDKSKGVLMVMDRDTGLLKEEKIPTYVALGIRLIYQMVKSPASVASVLRRITHDYGVKYSETENAEAAIRQFVAFYELDMEEALLPVEEYKTFNEFFFRRLKPDARPIKAPEDARVAVSAADCRLTVFSDVAEAQRLWIKGREFSAGKLLNDEELGRSYAEGQVAIFRLAPQDYHRFHSPVTGTIAKQYAVDGEYFTVNPMAVCSELDVYGMNKRHVTLIDTADFGRVAFVSVGATCVGSINFEEHLTGEGVPIAKGDPYGYFAFGGSTVVCLFEKGSIAWEPVLAKNTQDGIETLVKVGVELGTAAREV